MKKNLPDNLLTKIIGFKISDTNDDDNIAFWLSYIQMMTEENQIIRPVFFMQFIKGEFGKVDYLVWKNLFEEVISNTTQDNDTLWVLSNRTPDDIQIYPFYSVMQLEVITYQGNKELRWLISHPTIKWCLIKTELEVILKKFLISVLEMNESDLITFWLEETYSEKSLRDISAMIPQKIIFSQKKEVGEFARFFWFWINRNSLEAEVDWLDEEDIEYTVTVNKKNSGVFNRRLAITNQTDNPIQKVIVHTAVWTQVNDEFYYKQVIPVELTNWYLIWDQKNSFIKKTKNEVLSIFWKIYPKLT